MNETRGTRTLQLVGLGWLVWQSFVLPSSDLVRFPFAERHEQDACYQHPIRTDEGQPTLLDSESVFL